MTKQRATVGRRRATAGILFIATGITLLAATAVPAWGEDAPAFYVNPTSGHDAYLKSAHRGITAESKDNEESCPNISALNGETGWHFVLDSNDYTFLTLDVAFNFGQGTVQFTGLTPKSSADPTFDPATNFAAEPTGKHAYVFTAVSGTIVDAAAQVNPNATPAVVGDFQLSHTCVGNGTTTAPSTTAPTTTAPTTTTTVATTTTESVLGTTVTQAAPTTQATVAGIQVTRALPATGSDTDLLMYAGAIFLALGLGLVSQAKFLGARS